MFLKRICIAICLIVSLNTNAQSKELFNLIPYPASLRVTTGSLKLNSGFSVAIQEKIPDTIVVMAVNRMYHTLNRRTGLYFKQQYIRSNDNSDTAALKVIVSKAELPAIGTDESYSLTINNGQITLKATTTAGALHGLQTLLQLLTKKEDAFYFPNVVINDSPRFKWRGMMIDVSRHFIPLDVLERNIDAMVSVKMNVLHLHLSDNQGFRIESKVFPQLQNKGSNGKYYSQAQMKDLISFAEDRGITIVPEFDMPSHTQSWFAGYPQLSSSPGHDLSGLPSDFHSQKQIDIGSIMKLMRTTPFPAMDPSRETTYTFLDKFIGEMAALFPSSYIHIGADENNGVVWENNPAIVAFMKKNHIPDTHALQAYFVNRVHQLVIKHHKKMIGWEELFSNQLPKDVTVQVWQNSSYIKQATQHGNPILISKGFYLDLFMPAYIYYNNPDLAVETNDSATEKPEGGEAAQWTEIADKTNIETRIWPRAAAIAERLWSPASVNDVNDMYHRLFAFSMQLDDLGVQHIADYERSLRRYAGNDEITPIKTLTDVLTPIKGYKKLFAKLMMPEAMSFQTAPLSEISDILFVDSEMKWKFRWAVQSWLQNKDAASEKVIRDYLSLWQNNDPKLQNLFEANDQLKRVEQHSKDLSVIAAIGLEALDKIKNGEKPSGEWVSEKLSVLKKSDYPYGETELAVIPEIQSLVTQKLLPLPAAYSLF